MADFDVRPAPFPAASTQASGLANGLPTSVNCVSFGDKILLTISQAGKLAHWVHVPLAPAAADPMNPSHFASLNTDTENSLLPRSDLTATTVLGGTKREDEVVGQTLATTIASAILVKRPSEERMLVVGLGLGNGLRMERDGFEDIVGLCLECI